jgi:hypothetical protein
MCTTPNYSSLTTHPSRRSAQIAVEMLFLAALIVVLISGFVSLAASFLQLSVRAQNKLQSLAIAEAGIDYYRWHLSYAPQDFTDGTGHTGPYPHAYYDANGNQIGQFTLTITPPPPGSTVVAVSSAGTVFADSSIQKIVKVQLGKTSFAKYAIALNDNVRFGTGTEVFGPIFSNGGIHFDGLAHNIVESALACYQDPDYSGDPQALGVYTRVSPQDPSCGSSTPSRPDVFMAGRVFPLPALDFGQVTQTLASLKAQAQASGTYYASSTAFGYDLALATSGIYSLYKITALQSPPSGCTNTNSQSGWGTWSIQTETLVATHTIPASGVIFTEDDLWVRGQINGKRVTVAAGRFPENPATWANITINSSTLYTNYNGIDAIGLIAQNNLNVGLYSEDILRIDGALIAQNGRAGRYYYQSGGSHCGSYATQQQITLYGSIMSNQRYGYAYTDGTGYTNRILIYDPNLLYSPPPSFPLTSDPYTLISWQEVQ